MGIDNIASNKTSTTHLEAATPSVQNQIHRADGLWPWSSRAGQEPICGGRWWGVTWTMSDDDGHEDDNHDGGNLDDEQ